MKGSNTDPVIDLLTPFPIFHGFSPDQLNWVAQRIHQREFAPDQYILLSEQVGEAVYFVVNGALKIQIDQIGGTDIILAILGPGNIVGEMSLLGGKSGRSANVTPLAPSTLMWLDRQTFQVIMQNIPALSMNMMYMLAQRLRQANEQIRALSTLDVQGRVARQLLILASQFGKSTTEDDLIIPLRLTQSDLAALVGASRERVNQALGRIKRKHMLSVDSDGQFHLHNTDALAELCVGYVPFEAATHPFGKRIGASDLPPPGPGVVQTVPPSLAKTA